MNSQLMNDALALFNSLRAQIVTPELLAYLPNIIIAMFLGLFLGLERRRRHKSAGVRTMMVISGAAALISVLGTIVTKQAGIGDPTRIAAALLNGIGFLGAGVILKRGLSTQGVTTAAMIVFSVVVGMACGFGEYGIAVVITFLMIGALLLTSKYLNSREHCNPIVVRCKAEHKDSIVQMFGRGALLTGFEKCADDIIELHIEPEMTGRDYEALTHRLADIPYVYKVELEEDQH